MKKECLMNLPETHLKHVNEKVGHNSLMSAMDMRKCMKYSNSLTFLNLASNSFQYSVHKDFL